MNRATALAAVAGTILGATAVVAVQAVRRHRTGHVHHVATPEPSLEQTDRHEIPASPPEPVPSTIPVVWTPNLDAILAQRAAEQQGDDE